MSAQLIELLIFAVIAFLIISKLIATLGTTSNNDPTSRKSFFGEKAGLKDVTPRTSNEEANENYYKEEKINYQFDAKLREIIIEENESSISQGLQQINERLPSFNLIKFLKGAKAAFKIIIEDGANNKYENLSHLVDKRYLEQFKLILSTYGKLFQFSNLNAKISEIYMFGNNAFIKILFSGENITSNIKNFREEWTFSKSLINSGPDWYLNNIDRPQ